jgi:hypothetical protein
MTLDERAVMRWLMLSESERSSSPMGPPREALGRIAFRLREKMPVAKVLAVRRDDILRLVNANVARYDI